MKQRGVGSLKAAAGAVQPDGVCHTVRQGNDGDRIMKSRAKWPKGRTWSTATLSALGCVMVLSACGSNAPATTTSPPTESSLSPTSTPTVENTPSASAAPEAHYGESTLIDNIMTSSANASVEDAINSTIGNFDDLMGSADPALAAKYRELIVPKEQNYFDLEDAIKVGIKNELDNPSQSNRQAGLVAESWNTANVTRGTNQHGVPIISVQDLVLQFNPVVGAPQTITYGTKTVDFVYNPDVEIDGKKYGVWQICDDVTAGQIRNGQS